VWRCQRRIATVLKAKKPPQVPGTRSIEVRIANDRFAAAGALDSSRYGGNLDGIAIIGCAGINRVCRPEVGRTAVGAMSPPIRRSGR